MKIAILFLSSIAMAQTASVPSIPVKIPAQTIPAQTITIVTSRNGGKATFTVPAQTLPAQTVSTPATSAPVKFTPTDMLNLTFSCQGPDLQHLICKAITQ